MKRWMSKWRLVVIVIVSLLLLTAAAFAFFVGTETGTRFIWQRISPSLPDTVNVNSVQGRLIGPLAASGIEVQSDRLRLRIERIELDWSLFSLLGKRLNIQRLLVEEISMTQLKAKADQAEKESKPFEIPDAIVPPLDVSIDELRLEGMEFRPAPEETPMIIDTISLELIVNQQRAVIRNFFTRAPRFSVRGGASASLKKNFPVDGRLDWRFNPPDYPELAGQISINGSVDALQIQQQIDAPYGITATTVIRDALTQPGFKTTISAHPENLHHIHPDLPEMAVQMEITGEGSFEKANLQVSSAIETPDIGKAHLQLDAALRSETLSIDHLLLSAPGQPSRLTATGQLSLTGEQTFDVKAAWTDLQWPLRTPKITSDKGTMSISGRMDEYTVALTADLLSSDKAKASLQMRGNGTLNGVDLTQIEIASLEGKLKGSVALDWKPEIAGSINLNGSGVNPGVLFESWPGDLQLQVRASGRSGEAGPEVSVQTLKAQGRLRGNAFSLDAQGAYAANTSSVDRFVLSSGATTLQAEGTIGETADIVWKIDSPNLASLLPGAGGQIQGQGHITGPIRRPRCKAALMARNLAYEAYQLASMDIDVDADLNGKEQSHISIDVQGGKWSEIQIQELKVQARGNAGDHHLQLIADTNQGNADLSLNGQLNRPWESDMDWRFRVNTATLAYPQLDAWTLGAPFSGQVGATRTQIAKSCWQSGKARICFEGQLSDETILAAFDVDALPFSYIKAYLPEGIGLRGDLNGNGKYHRIGSSAPDASLLLTTTSAALWSYEDTEEAVDEPRRIIEFLPGRIQIDMLQGELKANVTLPVSNTDGIALNAAIASGDQPFMDRPVDARLRAGFQDLEFIQAWLPDVETLSGKLTGDLTLAGSLRHPTLNGRMELVDGAARLERPGLSLTEIRFTLQGEQNGAMRLSGRSVSGRGHITIDGTADFRDDAARADIRLRGENFTVYNTPQAEIESSPDLSIGLRDDVVDVTGQVMIPRANIQIKKLPESAVNVSEDQTIAGTEGTDAVEKQKRKINARVRITMGEEVFFNGFGLNAGIQGGLLAIEKPGGPTTGSGELNIVDGKYEAFGQELDVEKGRVLWAGGPISQPGIDARAVRRPEEGILVGVNVRGDLRQPEVTLFSDPVMTQGNQLSYLVLGRPLSGASAGEGSALSRAVLALGLKGGNVVAEKIGGRLGLDQFTVESSDNGSGSDAEQASLVIGKYLTPKLYINYGIGLFDPVSTLRLQYAISSNWKLVTESSSTASGGDLFYTIETGR